jgi:hypothetical protein
MRSRNKTSANYFSCTVLSKLLTKNTALLSFPHNQHMRLPAEMVANKQTKQFSRRKARNGFA